MAKKKESRSTSAMKESTRNCRQLTDKSFMKIAMLALSAVVVILAISCQTIRQTTFSRSPMSPSPPEDKPPGDCALPLAVHLPDAANSSFLLDIEDFVKKVVRDHKPHVEVRNFGAPSKDKNVFKGHRATFLQVEAFRWKSELIDELWRLTVKADVWGSAKDASLRPALRCLELIEYNAADGHSLSLHDDGCTMLTMALMLSKPGKDFQGGEVNFRRKNRKGSLCEELHDPNLGDVLVWKGPDRHGVQPVKNGLRRVLVAEWWADTTSPTSRGRPVDSLSACREAVRLDPQIAALHANLGEILVEAGRAAEAKASFKIGADLNPQEHRSRYQSIDGVLRQRGHGSKYEVKLVKAVKSKPKDTDAREELGQFFAEHQRMIEAEAMFKSVIALNPLDVSMSANVGILLDQRGHTAEAEMMMRRAYEINPLDPAGLTNLGAFLANHDRNHEAELIFEIIESLENANQHSGEALKQWQESNR